MLSTGDHIVKRKGFPDRVLSAFHAVPSRPMARLFHQGVGPLFFEAIMLTSERLHEVLHYDPETGGWRWLVNRGRTARAGDVAGAINDHGRRYIGVDGRKYKATRLAVLYMTGEWPKGEVDHRDLDRGNDRWENLRDATHAQNVQNRPAQKNSYTGFKGVNFYEINGRPYAWRVKIDANGICRRAYCYGTLSEAAALYEQWARELHGEFARAE
jgi:HNH endonuclease